MGVLNFIIYIGATTIYLNPLDSFPISFDNYINPSQIMNSFMTDHINKYYYVTMDNYYSSPEVAKKAEHSGKNRTSSRFLGLKAWQGQCEKN